MFPMPRAQRLTTRIAYAAAARLAAGVSEPGLQIITSRYFLTGADAVLVAAAALV